MPHIINSREQDEAGKIDYNDKAWSLEHNEVRSSDNDVRNWQSLRGMISPNKQITSILMRNSRQSFAISLTCANRFTWGEKCCYEMKIRWLWQNDVLVYGLCTLLPSIFLWTFSNEKNRRTRKYVKNHLNRSNNFIYQPFLFTGPLSRFVWPFAIYKFVE